MKNPLDFLPRPGDAMRLPGGALWCELWEVTRKPGPGGLSDEFEGTIVFRFRTSELPAVTPFRKALPEIPVIELGAGNVLPLTEGGAA